MSRRIDPLDIVDVVGVLAGLKPSSFVDYDERLAAVLNDLGLRHVPFGYDPEIVDLMAISKDQVMANKLAELLVTHTTEDDEREIGKLLGYPPTATEYYIKRLPTLRNPSEEQLPMIKPKHFLGRDIDEFHQLVLSPDHWQEEVDNFIAPLEAATKEMAPGTYDRIRRAARWSKLSGRVMEIVGGSVPPKYRSNTRVHYV